MLRGRRVLVTGGGRGIGRAIALLCAGEGARVAIISRTACELEQVVKIAADATTTAAKARVTAIMADVTNQREVETAVSKAIAALGGIDLLVNNAGGPGNKGPVVEQNVADFRRVLELNVTSVLMVSQAVLRQTMLQNGGDIVMVSSRAGKVGLANSTPYCASKFALEGLAASMACELEGKGVRVNTLSPGMVNTRSFPKPADKLGVRSADSVRAGLLTILKSGVTGMYLHVDELDIALARGFDADRAIKPINEPTFTSFL